jgi:hypothetical protein
VEPLGQGILSVNQSSGSSPGSATIPPERIDFRKRKKKNVIRFRETYKLRTFFFDPNRRPEDSEKNILVSLSLLSASRKIFRLDWTTGIERKK